MAKWRDVTDYFSESQRHYNGKYLEQDEVYDGCYTLFIGSFCWILR